MAAEPAPEAAPLVQEGPENYYTVRSSDGLEFQISEGAAAQSGTITACISNLDINSEDEERRVIPLQDIKGDSLELVIQWCEEHKGEPIPADDENVPKRVIIPPFDAQLLNIDSDLLLQLICAANYLDIRGLMRVSCKKVANMVRGKSPEEIRAIYGINSDEQDDAAAARAAAEWAKVLAAPGAEGNAAAAKEDDADAPEAADEDAAGPGMGCC